jgi:hypothetical protein
MDNVLYFVHIASIKYLIVLLNFVREYLGSG